MEERMQKGREEQRLSLCRLLLLHKVEIRTYIHYLVYGSKKEQGVAVCCGTWHCQ